MNCDMYQDLVAAHVDNALTEVELVEVDVHLRNCGQCHRLFEEEQRFHAEFSQRNFTARVPVDVTQRLHRALATESEVKQSVWTRTRVWLAMPFRLPRVAFGLVAVGILIAIVLPRMFWSAPAADVFAHAVHSYQMVTAGEMPMAYPIEDPQVLQQHINASGRLNFTTQVSDLRPTGYRLRGGNVATVAEQPLAVALYEAEEAPIVCLRQRGLLPPLPPGTKRDGAHSWYTANGYTAMFTQFPDHFCIMISQQPEESFRRRLVRMPGS